MPQPYSVTGGCIAAWFALFPTTANTADRLIYEFSSDTGDNAVGIVDAGIDTEIAGPQALSVDNDGNIFVLDQVNGRILRFDPKNPVADRTEFKLPADIEPTDLVVRKQDILVWDGTIRTMQVSGLGRPSYRSLEEVSTRAGDDPFVTSAFAQMGSQQPGSDSDILGSSTRSIPSQTKRERVKQ